MDVTEVCEDAVILFIIPFTGNILQRILSVFEKNNPVFLFPDIFADPISSR